MKHDLYFLARRRNVSQYEWEIFQSPTLGIVGKKYHCKKVQGKIPQLDFFQVQCFAMSSKGEGEGDLLGNFVLGGEVRQEQKHGTCPYSCAYNIFCYTWQVGAIRCLQGCLLFPKNLHNSGFLKCNLGYKKMDESDQYSNILLLGISILVCMVSS